MIDQGGTFTDIVSISPGKEIKTFKVLSNKQEKNYDPIIAGIKLVKAANKNYTDFPIDKIKIGTTIGTNALLERKGCKVALCVTKGFKDNFLIGTQQRKSIFSRHHFRKAPPYKSVIEVDERISNTGEDIKEIKEVDVRTKLKATLKSGIETMAIVLVNSFRFPKNEIKVFKIAQELGFKYISCSHIVCPTINFTSRGFTTLVDAYISPVIKKYVHRISKNIDAKEIVFMQSNGFLSSGEKLSGKNVILSGPAGGVVAGVKISKKNKREKVIGFDMGGTSTDIWHYDRTIEKRLEKNISDVFIKTPTLKIDSIAAGGGSIIGYKYKRLTVGPESAGSFPGPACYRNNGPLTLTDCNLVLGRILTKDFPKYFGKKKNLSIDKKISEKKFIKLLKIIQKDYPHLKSIGQLAEAYLKVAVDNMASAIKKTTIQRGFDIRNYTLLIFGSAAGQYSCKVAEALNLKKIIFHPLSGVLSSYGVGISKKGIIFESSVEKILNKKNIEKEILLLKKNKNYIEGKNKIKFLVRLKYEKSNSLISLPLEKPNIKNLKKRFHLDHKRTFGFNYEEKRIFVDSIEVEIFNVIRDSFNIEKHSVIKKRNSKKPILKTYFSSSKNSIKQINASSLLNDSTIKGPLIFSDFNTNIIVEKGWKIRLLDSGAFEIFRLNSENISKNKNKYEYTPELLEIFNNLFYSIADQMGVVLKNTAQSINVKERLDFSCALFDRRGNLIANAPHIPVHLGSMGETIKYLIKKNKNEFLKGCSLLHNNPFNGGTHLPDLTLVTPYLDNKRNILFYLANRAHHSDIGGISPGSMPAFSKNIFEEGILINSFIILDKNKIKEKEILNLLSNSEYPSRDPLQNLYDIKAQIASCKRGVTEVQRIIKSFGLKTVLMYSKHVQENSRLAIKRAIEKIPTCKGSTTLDNNSIIKINIYYSKKKNKLVFDFKGTSSQLVDNFNTPNAITKSVIIYFLRTLIKESIPLNEGCLQDIEILIPKKSMLNPSYPAPVVAGNVETSQSIIDLLNTSTNIQAACYGTMSNLTFGDENFGYYETICGGEGASKGNHGADAVHCHMTNTSITDVEILEWNYPVRLNRFLIRPNSGGSGQWKGGNGTIREIVFLKNLTVTILSNRRKFHPKGIKGGKNGKKGFDIIIKSQNSKKKIPHIFSAKLKKYDVLIINTPGGGGYGNKRK